MDTLYHKENKYLEDLESTQMILVLFFLLPLFWMVYLQRCRSFGRCPVPAQVGEVNPSVLATNPPSTTWAPSGPFAGALGQKTWELSIGHVVFVFFA